jgi:hypothetical protein
VTEQPDVERLAELDADIAAGLPVDLAAVSDPASRAVLDALAATRAELAALPPVPLPPGAVARWTAALTPARVGETDAPSSPIPHGGVTPTQRVDHPDSPTSPIRHAAPEAGEIAEPAPTWGRAVRPHEDLQSGAETAISDRIHTEPVITNTGGSAPDPHPTTAHSPEDHRLGATAATSGRGRTKPTITPPRPVRRRRPGVRRRPDRRPSRPAGTGAAGAPRPARTPRRTRPAIAVGLALVALLVVAGILGSRATAPSVTAAQLGGVARAAVGAHDAGELADPARRAGCLRSVALPGLDPDAQLIGARGVEFEGQPGILLVLASGRLGTFRVVVVDPACGPEGGTLLADTLIGR